MTDQEVNATPITADSVIVSDKFLPAIGINIFTVDIVDYSHKSVLGKCSRGGYWFSFEDINKII